MQTRGDKKEKLFSAAFISLFLINTVSSAGFYMTMPTLPKYAISCGMTLPEAGILTGIFSIAAIVARPFAGWIADRFNKKWLLFLLMAATAIITFGYSITLSRLPLYVWRILHGAAFAGTSTIQLTLAAGMIPMKRRGEGLGYMGMAQILAMSFAPSLGLWAAERWGYTNMFCISAAMTAAAAIGLAMLPWKHEQVSHARRLPKFNELFAVELFLLALMGSLFSLSNSIITSYLSMLADERGIMNIGLFFTVSSVAVLLCRPFSGKLMDRKGLWFIMVPCFLFGSAAMFLTAGSFTLLPLLAAAMLKGVAQSSGQSALQTDCVNRTSALRTGVAMSTCYLGNDLGQGIGNAVGGALSASLGYAGMFTVVGVIMLSGFGMMAFQLRADNRRKMKYLSREEESHA